MPRFDFFVRLGVFAVPGFLDAGDCAQLRGEAQSGAATMAAVVRGASELRDESSRRTRVVDVSAPTETRIQTQLRELRPALEDHFNLALRDCEKPQFLIYRPGDFFGAHTDSSDDESKPQFVRDRKVSVVVFLNSQSPQPQPETYGAGDLTLYGLMSQPGWEKYGFQLTGETGLLVAFRSHVWHAVEPVSHGERFTIVSWFY